MNDIVELVRGRARFARDPVDRAIRPASPITPDGVIASEAALGFDLPPLLKVLYGEIGNGGFGPGYGMLGLLNGATDDLRENAVAKLQALRVQTKEKDGVPWPTNLLPICNWGCAIYSCIDCSSLTHDMVIFDPNPHEDQCTDWSDSFFSEACGFDEWIQLWARGVDLWDRVYGPSGAIYQILESRQGAR